MMVTLKDLALRARAKIALPDKVQTYWLWGHFPVELCMQLAIFSREGPEKVRAHLSWRVVEQISDTVLKEGYVFLLLALADNGHLYWSGERPGDKEVLFDPTAEEHQQAAAALEKLVPSMGRFLCMEGRIFAQGINHALAKEALPLVRAFIQEGEEASPAEILARFRRLFPKATGQA